MTKNNKNWEKEKRTLRDLEQKSLIKITNPSMSGSSDLMDMTVAPNKIFLREIVLEEKGKKIRLCCKTKKGSDRQGSIKSENLELLREIKSEIEEGGLIGKSMSEVFSTRIGINRKFLKEKREKI